jgi:hypothetical protein
MAAGGFREFVAGEILDEEEINDFLMQGMLVFAGTAARGSAITSPVEGQFTFLKDSDTVEFYDGSAWVELSAGGIELQYLIIGGGAGGGRGNTGSTQGGSGGGGAGGYICNVSGESSGGGFTPPGIIIEAGVALPIRVGAGGAGAPSASTDGVSGTASLFAHLTCAGGGPGGGNNRGGQGGGSGGGSGSNSLVAGIGLANQGFAGAFNNGNDRGGGGGGASAAGSVPTVVNQGGNGGAGISSSITGSSVARGGGGGGGGFSAGGTATAGGGNGSGSGAATAGTVNTGGGGGGCGQGTSAAGAGGSGIVVLKYPSSFTPTFGVGLTVSTTTSGSFKISTITAGADTVTF